MDLKPLPRRFFADDADRVARALVGALLVSDLPEGRVVGRVVEAEAYFGPPGANRGLLEREDLPIDLRERLAADGDPASHAARGPTPRSQVMWGAPGTAYVYLIYGMYECLNVVTGDEGQPQAVLIRALEPVEGLSVLRERRPGVAERDILRGPGRLARAFGITRALTGSALTGPPVWFARGSAPAEVAAGPRVNVVGAEDYPFRFIDAGSPFVTRWSAAKTRR